MNVRNTFQYNAVSTKTEHYNLLKCRIYGRSVVLDVLLFVYAYLIKCQGSVHSINTLVLDKYV